VANLLPAKGSAKQALNLLLSRAPTAWERSLPGVFEQLRAGAPINPSAWDVLVQAVRHDQLFFVTSGDSLDHLAHRR
jgi:hypothetical protein